MQCPSSVRSSTTAAKAAYTDWQQKKKNTSLVRFWDQSPYTLFLCILEQWCCHHISRTSAAATRPAHSPYSFFSRFRHRSVTSSLSSSDVFLLTDSRDCPVTNEARRVVRGPTVNRRCANNRFLFFLRLSVGACVRT